MKRDLTKGNILTDLLLVAAPIILGSFFQTAYNITDMFWLGKVGSDAVASSGTAGFYLWLSFGFVLLVNTGTRVKIAHAVGAKEDEKVKLYLNNGLRLMLVITLVYLVVISLFKKQAIGFFGVEDESIVRNAIVYLQIVLFANIPMSINQIFAASFHGMGNSKIPLFIGSAGLVINMLLDPLFIIGFDLGVMGAGIATFTAALIVTVIYVVYLKKNTDLLDNLNFKFERIMSREILKIGLPTATQSILFTFIAMIIAKLVVDYGPNALAAQRVGAQVEALSWMTAGGIQTALSAFIGQNFGAKMWKRLVKGYSVALRGMFIYGIFITLLLYVFAEPIMGIFFKPEDVETILIGIDYLKILSLSQLGMIIELTTAGAFYGLGKANPPAIISISGNLLRIPLAMFLSSIIGITGIWWAITISSLIKGSVAFIWLLIVIAKDDNYKISYLFPDKDRV